MGSFIISRTPQQRDGAIEAKENDYEWSGAKNPAPHLNFKSERTK
jgi:hypothetical protein